MKNLITLLFAVLINTQINAQCFKVVKTDGKMHNLAIKTDGTLWGWGHNTSGQINSTLENIKTPTQIGTDSDWETVSLGNNYSVALKTDGTLWTWGSNTFGQLGDGTFGFGTEKYVPTQIGTDADWKYIAAGTYHTLAIKTDGSLWAWGANFHGELGDGTEESKYIPTKIGLDTWMTVAAGTYYTVAIKTGGTLWAWGDNSFGQIGDGTQTDGTHNNNKNSPIQIGSANNWKSVSASAYHNVAMKTDNSLWAWGDNLSGKLGTGISAYYGLVPLQIGTSTDWKMAAAGGVHTLAVKKNGTLWAWGDNINGEYGNGSFYYNNFIPGQIGTATNWSSVAVGFYHTVLTTSDGALLTTGSNYLNQIGDGTTVDRNIPFQVGCATLGNNKVTALNTSFNLYPNPTKEILYLQNSSNHFIDKITVVNTLGKTILEQTEGTSQINTQQLQRGLYLLRINSEGEIYSYKFIKQ